MHKAASDCKNHKLKNKELHLKHGILELLLKKSVQRNQWFYSSSTLNSLIYLKTLV